MNSVEWGEFKLEKLFEKIKVNSLKYKTKDLPKYRTSECPLPALTAGIENQGLNNYVPNKGATILKNVISISANGANTGATFYQNREFTVLQDAYAIKWIFDKTILSDNQYLFLTSSISKTIYGNYEWTNKAGWERIKTENIKLPINTDGSIDFEFMESFIAELEAERVAELSAYLKVSGLDNYELSVEEQNAIQEYETLDFSEFDITEIFESKNTSNILSTQITENSGDTPYLCASSENNGVSSYITYDERYLEKGNCIFIGGKTFVVSYQANDFFSNDSHNLALYLKNCDKSKLKHFYIATCLFKSLSHKYSWGNSISKTKIKNDKISLPIKDGKPNYDVMDLLISAVQKLVIKDVVKYSDAKLSATKQIDEK
mgnify:CR=1 FL=1